MGRLSIRVRLTVIYGGLLVLALVLSGTAVVILLRHRLLQHLDAALDKRTCLARARACENEHIPGHLDGAKLVGGKLHGAVLRVR